MRDNSRLYNPAEIRSARRMAVRTSLLLALTWLLFAAPNIVHADGLLLFYDANNGVGALSRIDRDGNYSFIRNLRERGFREGWTHVVGTENGAVLFYNAEDGAGATAVVDRAGNYSFVRDVSVKRGWTHVTSAHDTILFYNATNGVGATALLDRNGNYTFVENVTGVFRRAIGTPVTGFGTGWTHVTGTVDVSGTGLVFFYNATNGDGATAIIRRDGTVKKTVIDIGHVLIWHDEFPGSFPRGMSHVISVGNGYLFLYANYANARAWTVHVLFPTTALPRGDRDYISNFWPLGWTHVVGTAGGGSNLGGILFYNVGSGEGAIATVSTVSTVSGRGFYTFVDNVTGPPFRRGWTHIAGLY
jgi:hypothetical protein